MVYEFASTSKVTLPGAGISCFACSEANMAYMEKLLTVQVISFDKVNQQRHVLYLKDKAHTLELMKKHAAIMGPKFRCVVEALDREIAPLEIASWRRPKGGYFVSLNAMPGTAKRTLALCKDGVKILNYARGELVNTEALLEAMEIGKVSGYMTDFPSEAILGKPGIVCTPHLGASTPEAEDNCAVMAAKELSDYLKNGNIIHSVNMPEVNQPRAGGKRICIIHKNEPGMISQITALTTEAGLNIENMVNKSKKNMAYTMLDATGAVDKKLAEKLAAIPAVIRVRIL